MGFGDATATSRIQGKSLGVRIGDSEVRMEAGWITPGVASVFAMSAGRTVLNEHATPAQLRELSALCLRTADEAEAAEREAGS